MRRDEIIELQSSLGQVLTARGEYLKERRNFTKVEKCVDAKTLKETIERSQEILQAISNVSNKEPGGGRSAKKPS